MWECSGLVYFGIMARKSSENSNLTDGQFQLFTVLTLDFHIHGQSQNSEWSRLIQLTYPKEPRTAY